MGFDVLMTNTSPLDPMVVHEVQNVEMHYPLDKSISSG